MAYGDFKDLPRRTPSDKVLRDKACNIASNPEYGEQQHVFVSMVYNFFDKKSGEGAIKSNQQLADELHKPIIRKFQRRKEILLLEILVSGVLIWPICS